LAEQNSIKNRLRIAGNQEVYFTNIEYDEFIYSEQEVRKVKDIVSTDKLLLAGIANPASFFTYLQTANDVCMDFPDHHHFSEKDILDIRNKSRNKIIITTEKDYVRLLGRIPADQLFYLPIKSQFLIGDEQFRKTIMNYVGTSTRDSKLRQ
jgi:tetraacyldisaccharide 4'-kinase